MKKLLTILLSAFMITTLCLINVGADEKTEVNVETWQSFGANVTYCDNKVKIGTEVDSTKMGGAVSYDARGKEINEAGITVSTKVNVNLENDSELFTISVGLGTDADNYSDELCVMTQKSNGKYSANVLGKTFDITEGINKYSWTFKKVDNKTQVSFAINDEATEFKEMNKGGNVIRYVWAFGREVEGKYKLDEPLEIILDEPVCSNPNKVQAKEWASFGSTITKVNCDNRITIGTEGGGAVSWDAKGKEVNETGITVSTKVNVNLKNDGELFTISVGLGTDADNYSDELCVETDKTGGKYVATVFGKKFEIEEGINTYSWTFVKHGSLTLVSFGINDEATDFNIMTTGGNVVRYVWAFGRQVDEAYRLDEPLEIYLRATPSYDGITFGGKTPDSNGAVELTYTGDGISVGGFDKETSSVNSTYQYQIRKINDVAQTSGWKEKTISGNTGKLDDIKDVGKYEIEFQVIGDMDEVGKGEQKTYIINVIANGNISNKTSSTVSTKSYDPKDKNHDGVISCAEEMNSANWTWSETKKACVYRVTNTSAK